MKKGGPCTTSELNLQVYPFLLGYYATLQAVVSVVRHPKKQIISDNSSSNVCVSVSVHRAQSEALPGFGTQCFDFVFFNELTASELLYLTVQVTDVPHCDTHRESCSQTRGARSSPHTHTHWEGINGVNCDSPSTDTHTPGSSTLHQYSVTFCNHTFQSKEKRRTMLPQ